MYERKTVRGLRVAIFVFSIAAVAAGAMANTIISVSNYQVVARLTGTPSLNNTASPSPLLVGGADLGIPIYHNGKTYFLFGDTFSGETSYDGGNWRRNTMAWSTDTTPSDGIIFDGWATNTLGKAKVLYTNNEPSGSGVVSTLPTGGISANGELYVYFMNHTSYGASQSELARFNPTNNTFATVSGCTFAGTGNFIQVAVREGQGSDPYLYVWGTPYGRGGGVKLARVLPAQIETRGAYQFYDGTVGGTAQWNSDEFQADQIVPGGVGEMSVMYNQALGAWTLMYLNGVNDRFEIRQAPNPWGPWSNAFTVMQTYLELQYSPMMLPSWVENDGQTVYFTMSDWGTYDVYLAKATLNMTPEPAAMSLLALGGLAVMRRRRK